VRIAEAQKRMILRGFDLLKREGLWRTARALQPAENESVVDCLLNIEMPKLFRLTMFLRRTGDCPVGKGEV